MEVLSFATWNPEDIMLHEVNRHRKTNTSWSHL
jgi:hypothetical protein